MNWVRSLSIYIFSLLFWWRNWDGQTTCPRTRGFTSRQPSSPGPLPSQQILSLQGLPHNFTHRGSVEEQRLLKYPHHLSSGDKAGLTLPFWPFSLWQLSVLGCHMCQGNECVCINRGNAHVSLLDSEHKITSHFKTYVPGKGVNFFFILNPILPSPRAI